jgi:hypothetical protein
MFPERNVEDASMNDNDNAQSVGKYKFVVVECECIKRSIPIWLTIIEECNYKEACNCKKNGFLANCLRENQCNFEKKVCLLADPEHHRYLPFNERDAIEKYRNDGVADEGLPHDVELSSLLERLHLPLKDKLRIVLDIMLNYSSFPVLCDSPEEVGKLLAKYCLSILEID